MPKDSRRGRDGVTYSVSTSWHSGLIKASQHRNYSVTKWHRLMLVCQIFNTPAFQEQATGGKVDRPSDPFFPEQLLDNCGLKIAHNNPPPTHTHTHTAIQPVKVTTNVLKALMNLILCAVLTANVVPTEEVCKLGHRGRRWARQRQWERSDRCSLVLWFGLLINVAAQTAEAF